MVWVVSGWGPETDEPIRPKFPTGVFLTLADAERAIRRTRLSATVTQYPLNTTVYDWAVAKGDFEALDDADGWYVQSWTSAISQEHEHYEDGV